MPPMNFINHASEVVCVAIGANLLLPVAPSILKKYLDCVDTSASNIIKTKFKGVADFLHDEDFKLIGVACKKVEDRRSRCNCKPGLKWYAAEILMAVLGVFLLWSNWVEQPIIAAWCPLLFLPVVFAVAWPYGCYAWLRWPLSRAIRISLKNAREAKRRCESERAVNNDDYIVDFVEEARQAARQG